MIEQDRSAAQLRFDGYVLDPVSEELSRDGELLPLSPQPTRVLALLAANAGRTVSREEIQRHVWGGAHVEADVGLNSCIRKIRAQLDDDPNDPRFIRTLPRRGYRFVAPVAVGGGEPPLTATRPSSRTGLAIVAALAIVVLAGWWVLYSGRPSPESPGAAGTPPRVVAVLPFEDLVAESAGGFLGDGITEETIARLGRVDPARLAVLARTTSMHLKGADRDPLEIAEELGAHYLVRGSLRRSDGRLRLSVQLSDAASGLQVAAESFDATSGEPLSTESALANRVAAWLVTHLLPRQPPLPLSSPQLSARLYEVYLRGLHELGKGTGEGYLAARDRFEAVIREAPLHVEAWLGLAESELWLAWFGAEDPASAVEAARVACERAIELDPTLAAPHALLGYASLYVEFDFEAAGSRLAEAAALEPGSARAQSWYASYLSAVGEHDEAIERARISRRLDPLSMGVRADLCWLLNYARRFVDALDACDAALALQPGDAWTTMGKLEALRQLGREADAVRTIAALAAAAGGTAMADAWVREADLDPLGAFDESLAWLEAKTASGSTGPRGFHAASIAAVRGRELQALEFLANASERSEMMLVFLGVDPRFDSLRSEPAFRDLLVRLGLSAPGPRDAPGLPTGADGTQSQIEII